MLFLLGENEVGGLLASSGLVPSGKEKLTGRKQLDEVVAQYETKWLSDETCSERLAANDAGLVIEGDRRNLPDYDIPPSPQPSRPTQ